MNDKHLMMHVAHETYKEAEHNLRVAVEKGEDTTEHFAKLQSALEDKKYALDFPDNRKCIFCGQEHLWDDKQLVMFTLAAITQFGQVYADEGEIQDRVRSMELAPSQRPILDVCKECVAAKGFSYLLEPDFRKEEKVQEKKLKVQAITNLTNVLANAVVADKFEDKE